MGLFGGSSKSSTSNKTYVYDSVSNQIDGGGTDINLNLQNASNNPINASLSQTFTDFDSINRSFDFAESSVTQLGATVKETVQGALDLVDSAVNRVQQSSDSNFTQALTAIGDNLNNALSLVNDSMQPDGGLTKDIVQILALTAAGFGLLYALR